MDPRASPMNSTNIGDILNLPTSMDLLDGDDFESTMLLLDNSGSASPASGFRREDPDNLELNLTALGDVFGSHDTESPHDGSYSVGTPSCLSPDLKIRINGRTPAGGNGEVFIKQEAEAPDFSPVMDSFLRESWDDIVGAAFKSARPSFKSVKGSPSPFTISTTPGRVNPLPLNFLDLICCGFYGLTTPNIALCCNLAYG